MADLSKITLPNGTIVDLKDAKKTGVYTVIGTQTDVTGAWTGNINVGTLYAGLTIAYFLPYSGTGSALLNLTLADGTTTGAKACYYNNTAITTQYPAGSTILMTYWPAGSISVSGTPTTDDRWVAIANYDTDTNTWRNLKVNNTAWKDSSITSGAANFADGTNITLTTNSAALTISSNRYGACSTAAATAAKAVTIAGTFTLEAGAMAVVNFANKNTASSPTLNVNSTGAKNIFLGSSQITTGANKGALKGLCIFVYDGTQYRLVSSEITSSTTGNGNAITSISASNGLITATKDTTFLTQHQIIAQDGIGGGIVNRYAICATAAGTAEKTASITSGTLLELANGVRVTVFFANKNTAATPTLNINNTGAVAIRHNGSTLSGSNVGLLQGAIDFVYSEDMAWDLVGNYIDSNTTYTGTSPISVSGTSISHANSGATAGSYGDSSAQTPSYGGTFKVPYVTVDAKGHVTGISDHTVKIPASDNTNTTYTFANGTNGFTVTPSGGTAQTVTVTPSIAAATTSTAGLMSAADKTKLNGIATGAEVNQNAFSNVAIGSTTIAADAKTDTLTLAAGSNVTLTPDATNDKVTIAATDTTYDVATLSEDGLMSTSDRAFLDDLSYPAYLNGAVVPKGQESPTQQVTNYAVCSTAAATVAKTVNTGWDFDLYTGSIVFIKFTVTNSGAVASLTLNVNDTGAKPIKYRAANLSSAGTLAANRVYGFVYDGANWELMGDLDTNSNTYDRTYINTTFKAATATSASFLLCGTDAGYKNVAKGTAFDISYPLLYCGTAIAAGGTRSDGYIQIPINCTTTNGGTSPAFTAYKMVFLKGKLTAGKTFTIDSSTLFTQAVPTSADGFHYYCVGLAGSATNIFLTPHHDVYEYLGGSFHKVSVYAEDAAKVNGLTVQTAVPANAKFTDTTYSVATTSADGLMSSTDKSKLNSHVVTVASTTGPNVSQLTNQNANSLSGTSVNHIKDNRPNTSNPDAFMFQMAYSDSWKSQFVQDPRNNKAYVRNLNNGTWGSWAEVYTSASPSPDTTYTANTVKLVTTTVPNVTSVGSAPTLGTAIPADDITAWTANTATTPMTATASEGVLTLTAGSKGTAASLSYTAKSIPNVTSVGSAPTLGTAITVATGSTSASGSGATVATGITAN